MTKRKARRWLGPVTSEVWFEGDGWAWRLVDEKGKTLANNRYAWTERSKAYAEYVCNQILTSHRAKALVKLDGATVHRRTFT